jgi:leucyl/phenylalanyl-tRNA--protein transferase
MLCKRLTIAGGAQAHTVDLAQRRLNTPPLECKQTSRLNESMASRESALIDITPEVLLKAYSCGIFPMAESADDPALYWIEPERRGIIPLDRFHLPGRLARTVRSSRYTVIVDRDFEAVINGCAQPQPGRTRTWINSRIRSLYCKLYERGDCHTVEVYDEGELIGGLYGVSLGRAFFGESMFHRVRDASKIALVHLVARLKAGRYRLLDTQFVTDHLRTFGAIEVARPVYHRLLDAALVGEADFAALPLDRPLSGETVLAALRQS